MKTLLLAGLAAAATASSAAQGNHLVRSEKEADGITAEVHRHGDNSDGWGPADDPCRYLGCNGPKCEWRTGERVRKVVTKKTCKNAKVLTPHSDTPIQTLTQCLRA